MRSLRHFLLFILAVIVVGDSPGFAGPIRVRIDGLLQTETYESGEDIVVSVGDVTSLVRTVQVFDSTLGSDGLPDDDIGHLVIEGTGTPFSGTELRILIGGSAILAFPGSTQLPIPPGCASFRGHNPDGSYRPAGITILNPSNPNDRSLLKISRLVLSAVDQITGDITVGKVFRVQAGVSTLSMPEMLPDVFGGDISANITAIGRDNFPENTRAIEQIRAGHGITGNIVATGEEAYIHTDGSFKPATIRAVIVGPRVIEATDLTGGIKGDIRAEFGEIVQIWTTGQIGLPDDPTDPNDRFPRIEAWRNIGQIRTITEIGIVDEDTSVPGTLRPISVFANIIANKRLDGSPTTVPVNINDGQLGLIEVGGDLNGFVRATTILPVARDARNHGGILVHGKITAPISILVDVQNADIIAERILEPVTIGSQLKGSVVAFGSPTVGDPQAGFIHSVIVGMAEDLPTEFDTARPRGFIGNQCPPLSLFPTGGHSSTPWLAPVSGFPCLDIATVDSTIYADHIGSLQLYRMGQFYVPTQGKPHRPRVEARRIESVSVGQLESGVIWSGNLEYDAVGQVLNDDTNDYASIGAIDIGCVGATADLWFRDCIHARFGNVSGEFHLPWLAGAEMIRIAASLDDSDAECGCLAGTGGETGVPCAPAELVDPLEESPRGTRTAHGEPSNGVAPVGKIALRSSTGLGGQIIINADDLQETASARWKGFVSIGDDEDGSAPDFTISPTASQPLEAPYYEQVSANLGGGAVGLARFHLYEADCEPPHDPDGVDPGITEAALNGDNGGINIRFYGPIRKKDTTAWSSHIRVLARPFPPGCDDPPVEMPPEFRCAWTDVTAAFNVFGPSTTTTDSLERRTIRLEVKNGYHVAAGIYMVRPKVADSVKCEDVAGNPPVIWPGMCNADEDVPTIGDYAMAYGFVVSGDCDEDETLDQFDCDLSTCQTECGIADFNHSGTITVQDIFDFLYAYFNNCDGEEGSPCFGADADVNDVGGVTLQDIFDFLALYFTCGA